MAKSSTSERPTSPPASFGGARDRCHDAEAIEAYRARLLARNPELFGPG